MKNNSLIKDLFGAFITEIHQGLAVIDDTGSLVICNARFAEIFRTDQAFIGGVNIAEIIPGVPMGAADQERIILLHPEQKISLKIRPIGNETTGLYRLLIITETAGQQLEKMKLLNDSFKTILDNIDEGVMAVDSENRITYCNGVQLKFDGLKLEDIVGRHTWDVYNFDAEISTLRQCLEKETPLGTYVQYYISNYGQYIRVTGNNFPVRRDKKTVGAVAVYRNLQKSEEMVGKIVNLQKRLQENQSELESALISGASPKKRFFSFEDILGESDLIVESVAWAKSAAHSDSPVFLFGETGTGKEMFAQSIHNASHRHLKPLISINCAAIPENLLEGIIFGTVKGVYTGSTDRKGLFEEAEGGTLFLDEINSMPINLQSKLLRALEERKIRRLGGRSEISVDVRIISSCNIDPQEAISLHLLRNDLYYRLAVINIDIPPLRQRKKDIRILTNFFVNSFNDKFAKNICEIDPGIIAALETDDWPGNIRQLKHCIESAMNLVPDDEPILSKKYLPRNYNNFLRLVVKSNEHVKEGEVFTEIREQEYQKIIDTLKRHGGKIAKTADELGISRQVLYYRLRKFGIK